ncbi:hypothetical protein C0J52_09121, partial [Blattella germanica]
SSVLGVYIPIITIILFIVLCIFCLSYCCTSHNTRKEQHVVSRRGQTEIAVIRVTTITETEMRIIPDDKPPTYEELFGQETQNGLTNVSFESQIHQQRHT